MQVEARAVAADDDEVRDRRARADAACTSTGAPASTISTLPADAHEAVGAAEGRHRAAALAHRIRGEPAVFPSYEADEQVLGAAALGVDAHRRARAGTTLVASSGGAPASARITGATNSWKVKIGRRRKAGQDHDGASPRGAARQRACRA